jgi:hypothetical protein
MSLLPPRLVAEEIPPLTFDGFSLNQQSLLASFMTEWTAMGAMFR